MALSPTSYNLTPPSTGLAVYFLLAPQGAVQVISPVDANGTAFATASDIAGGLLVSSEPATVQADTGSFSVPANGNAQSNTIDCSRYRKIRLSLNNGAGVSARLLFINQNGNGTFYDPNILSVGTFAISPVADIVMPKVGVVFTNTTNAAVTANASIFLSR